MTSSAAAADPIDQHLLPQRRRLRLAAALAMAQSALVLAQPWPLTLAVDHVIGGRPLTGFLAPLASLDRSVLGTVAAGAFVGVVLLGSAMSYAETMLVTKAGERLSADLRSTVLRKLLVLGPVFHDRYRSGDLVSRMSGDVARVQDAMAAKVTTIVPETALLVGMIVVLLRVDPVLGLVALAAVPVLALLARERRTKVRRAQEHAREASGQLSALTVDLVRNVRLVQAFGRQRSTERRFEERSDAAADAAISATLVEARYSPINDLVLSAGSAAVLGVGISRVIDGAITTGTLLVVLSYVGQVYSPVRRLSRLSTTLARGAASRARLSEVLDDRGTVPELEDAPRCPPLRRSITFDDVSFAYRSDAPVLRGLSFEVAAGEHVAIVGRTGAGKSTLLQLLMRFYDPTGGSIRFDGIDLRLVSLVSLRQRLGVVPQRSWVFDGSIADNIVFGRDDVSVEELRLVSRLALVDEFVDRLPDGFDTQVGESGAQLSGGQLKRISLARALIRMPDVLVLDEPTTGLDRVSEAYVVEAINRIARARTVLTVTHHLGLAQAADRVVVLEGGRVIEVGPPAFLADNDGPFARLLEAGAGSPTIPAPRAAVLVGASHDERR